MHSSNLNFDVNDGLSHCIDFDGTLDNVNVNNGTLIIIGNVSFDNLTVSNSHLINLGNLTFLNDFEVKSSVLFENYGEVNSIKNLMTNGLIDNNGEIFSNTLTIQENGTINNNKKIIGVTLIIDNTFNANEGIQEFQSTLINGSGSLNLNTTSFISDQLYNDGVIISTDLCSGIVSENITGNSPISNNLICDGSCTCTDSNLEVIWSDGFIGAFRDNLQSGNYAFDISEDGIIISHSDIIVPKTLGCDNETLFSNYLEIYPNPQMLNNEPQIFELSLSQISNVEVKIYNTSGSLIATPLNGIYAQGVHTVEWLREEDSTNTFYIGYITINGATTRRRIINEN